MTSVKFFGILVGAGGEGYPRTARLSPEAPTSNVIAEIGKTRPSPLINTDDTDQERDRVHESSVSKKGCTPQLGSNPRQIGMPWDEWGGGRGGAEIAHHRRDREPRKPHHGLTRMTLIGEWEGPEAHRREQRTLRHRQLAQHGFTHTALAGLVKAGKHGRCIQLQEYQVAGVGIGLEIGGAKVEPQL